MRGRDIGGMLLVVLACLCAFQTRAQSPTAGSELTLHAVSNVVLLIDSAGPLGSALRKRVQGQLSDLPVRVESDNESKNPALDGVARVRLSLVPAVRGAWVTLTFGAGAGGERTAQLMFLPLSNGDQATSSSLETAALVVRLAMQAALYEQHVSTLDDVHDDSGTSSEDERSTIAVALGSDWSLDGTGSTGRVAARIAVELGTLGWVIGAFVSAGAPTDEGDTFAAHRLARHAVGIRLAHSILRVGPWSAFARAGLATFAYQRSSESINGLFTARRSRWSPAIAVLPELGLDWQASIFTVRICAGLEVIPDPPQFSYRGENAAQPFVIPKVAPSVGLTLLGTVP